MTIERHPTLQELTMPPSAEWSLGPGWVMARVATGAAYWLQRNAPARDLGPGNVILTAHGGQCSLRASQLGPLKIQFFVIEPSSLNGLLTLAESRQLETKFNGKTPYFLVFNSDERVANEFAQIVDEPQSTVFSRRCLLLQLWADAVSNLLAVPAIEPANPEDLHERFRRMVGEMLETELSDYSLSDLAGRLGSSKRHFRRLYLKEFGVPLQERQIELRLLRARYLLKNSDKKIINVACDSGFKHLGQFNAKFKKRFGMTPNQWRHQQTD